MKTPDEIKKGLEHCTTDGADCTGCIYRDECMEEYDNAPIQRDALAYIKQLEEREWELFDLLSSAWFTKGCYFKQEDGMVYSRVSGEYITFDQAIDEFAHELTDETQLEAATPQWISVEERLPDDDVNVLVYAIGNNENDVIAMTSYTHNMLCYGIEGWRSPWQYFFAEYKITHWMPLPEPPKEG